MYFCNTTSFSIVSEAEVSKISSYPLKLFVDLTQDKIKLTGDIANIEIEDGKKYAHVASWSGDSSKNRGPNAFFASNLDHLIQFQNGLLAVTSIREDVGESELAIFSYLADCDAF